MKIVVSYGQASPPAGTFHREQRSAQKCRSEYLSGDRLKDFPHDLHAEILSHGQPLRAFNPVDLHREFPNRWSKYIRTNFSDLRHVMRVFAVSERTARKWWNAETGANGGHVAVAMAEHPVAAPRMLFAAE